jgi:hypothetical protein
MRELAVVVFCAALAMVALVGCGGASSSGSNGAAAGPAQGHSSLNGGAGGAGNTTTSGGTTGSSSGGQAGGSTAAKGPRYLVKSLSVNMSVKDPRQTAAALQTWVTTTDPQATSEGLNYQQIENNQYDVTLTFAVEASLYPQIERYLAGYPEQQGGQLLSLQETVQDVTNDYVDTQAQLANLRNEQQRLQTIMSQATSLNDILTIEQQVSQVQGQIQQIEAHLNALNGQTTFYLVTISLAPLGTPGQVAPPGPFDPGGTLHNALAAALVVAEWLATVLIWVAVFSLFAIPVGIVVLAVRRIRRAWLRRRQAPVVVG